VRAAGGRPPALLVLALLVPSSSVTRFWCDRVQRRGGLVHQDHVRLDGDGAGDAQPLRLPARQAQARRLQAVFHLVPQRGPAQRVLDDLVQLVLVVLAVDARPVGDVVVDRLGERVRFLEDHADAPAHGDRRDILAVQRDPAVINFAFHAGPATRSFMRLKARSTVVLPLPDEPMNAVISCS
jgi:hypothetical protein